MKWTLILMIISLPTICHSSSVCSSPSLVSTTTGCLCAGSNLQLLCSVIGGVNTVWTGSAIADQCNSGNIILRHSGFPETVRLSCNSEAVVGQSLLSLSNISSSCYTSRLSISVTNDLNGADIRCQVDNTMQPFPEVGQYNISLTSEPYSPPNDTQLINITTEGLTFNWTSVDPTCSDISYRVFTTDCGNCPNNTNSTTVVCSGIELSGDTQMCTLSVQSVVCGDIVSNFSDPLSISLQATNLPRASILPRYWQNTSNLAGLEVEIPIDPVVISGISVAVKTYRVNYFNSVTGDICGPAVELSLADEITTCTSYDMCKVRRDLIQPESCGNDGIDVAISATSILGTGPPTQPLRIDGTNKFVNITFDSEINKFCCTFLNQQDTSGKSCNVSYASCGDQMMQTVMGHSNIERPNFVEIQLNLESRPTYCYVAAASNDTFTILIEGKIVKRGEEADDGLSSGGVAGIVLGVIFFLILCICGILILIVVLLYIARKSHRYDCKNVDHEQPQVEMTAQSDTDTKKGESDSSRPLQIESIPATKKTDENDDSIPGHDPNGRATDAEDKPDSDHNQKPAKAVSTTMGVDETTDGSENKKATECDQSSDQAQVTTESSVDPDKGCTEETMSKDNNNEQASDFVIVMQAQDQPPEWTLDKDAPDCMRCKTRFTFTHRRHHCRYCGYVVCDSCSKKKAVLPWEPSKEQRVCNQCYETLSTANKEKN